MSRAAQADAAALLSSWWSRPVEIERERWTRHWRQASAAAEALGLDPPRELESAARDASADALVDEYERLFVGPGRTECPPYESLWHEGGGTLERSRLMGAAAGAIAELFAELGVSVSRGAAELPDHVAVEWEALALALQRDDEDARHVACALLDDHLRVWLPAFCASVAEHTTEPFYAALAVLTREWTAALCAHVVSA